MDTMAVAGSNSAKVREMIVVGSELAESAWPHIVPLLVNTEKHWNKYFTYESIQQSLIAGTAQVWLMNDENGFQLGMLTELIRFPTGVKQVHVLWLGGKHFKTDGINLADQFERWCAKRGASEIRAYGRRGMARLLKSIGYKETQVVLVKDIRMKMES